jgi:hypothetical protein
MVIAAIGSKKKKYTTGAIQNTSRDKKPVARPDSTSVPR